MSSASVAAHFSKQLDRLIQHLDHILPNQAPLQDFVHHNTLHGFQHLPFEKAVESAFDITGKYAYLPIDKYREYYQQGRINDTDLKTVLDKQADLDATKLFADLQSGSVYLHDIYRVALLQPLDKISACQLNWQVEENAALSRFQADVSAEIQQKILESGRNKGQSVDEASMVASLWRASLANLGLSHYVVQPEDLQELSPQQAEQLLYESDHHSLDIDQLNIKLAKQSQTQLRQLLDRVGNDLSLTGLIKALTGENINKDLDPIFIRYVSAWLDQGVSAWQINDHKKGFYQAWKQVAKTDLIGVFDDMPAWNDYLDALPDQAEACIQVMLKRIGIDDDKQIQYLQNIALGLQGWAGMFLWRANNPNYRGFDTVVDMRDYLAVRLVMEYFYSRKVCESTWLVDMSLENLHGYFYTNHAEFLGRYCLFNQHLPEYLVTGFQNLLVSTTINSPHQNDWQGLTQMLWLWQQSPASDNNNTYSVYRSSWRLFRLAQHMGWCGTDIDSLTASQLETIFKCLDKMDDKHVSGFIWLQAYELHYREIIFNAISYHHQYQADKSLLNWSERKQRPQAQLIFCIDDREESIRRHLEELSPKIETFGFAAFFNLTINWRGLDDKTDTRLCPVVETPIHRLREQAQTGCDAIKQKHDQRHSKRLWLQNAFFQEMRLNPLITFILMLITVPFTLISLLGKTIAPLSFGRMSQKLKDSWDLKVPTKIAITAEQATAASAQNNQEGYTDQEQADKVAGFLRNIGLTHQFSPLVVLVGHGSVSLNNPHLAAYDCGACSGRHSGPNARAFAAMANRPEIRVLMAKQAMHIPDDCWFLGAMHNTANEEITWFDTEQMPESFQTLLTELQQQCQQAAHYSAHERCRKLASAPNNNTVSLNSAYTHSMQRSLDISQVRPELGHSTNALTFVGRRSFNRGIFFDRRAFLVSYDYRLDPEGIILENTLLNGSPVVAGINLEYYFSTVNNEEYGCGQKTLHNLTGLFGVMEGGSSDLRTGLPWQMLDIHEPMRLQVMVEVKVAVMTAIYQRQPALQELVGNGWLLFSVKDPDSDRIYVFEPDQGFVLWQGQREALKQVERSIDCYKGKREHLMPVLLKAAIPGESA